MRSLKKNLLEWRWIWTIFVGIMWSLANSFSINQLGLWWPISKSSWRIWILRGCRIQTQIDPQSSDESIVSINVWSFVISIFQCFVAGIHSCWASPQARITQCWEPGSCHSCQSLHSHLRVGAILWNKPCPPAVQSWWKISLSNAHIWANMANVVQKHLPKQFTLCQFISPSLENHKNRTPLALLGATRDLPSCQPIDFQEPPVV